MLKKSRILNKQTGQIFYGEIETLFQSQESYPYMEIPDDGQVYIYSGGQAVVAVDKVKAVIIQKIGQVKFLLQNLIKQSTLETKPQNLLYLSLFDSEIQTCIKIAQEHPTQITLNAITYVIEQLVPPSYYSEDDINAINLIKNQFLQILQQ